MEYLNNKLTAKGHSALSQEDYDRLSAKFSDIPRQRQIAPNMQIALLRKEFNSLEAQKDQSEFLQRVQRTRANSKSST